MAIMKVKTFRGYHKVDEEEINKFIQDKKIHDIKFTSVGFMDKSNRHIEHFVMVLYED